MTPLQQKLRTAMLANAGIAAFLGANNIFTGQLPAGVMGGAASVIRAMTLTPVSAAQPSTHDRGIQAMVWERIQFTSWCKGPTSDLDAVTANGLIIAFLNTFDATGSAVSHPNIVLSKRITVYAQTSPPLYMGILDARILNREDLN